MMNKRVSELHTRQQAADNNAVEQQHNPAVALPSFSYYNCVTTIPVPPEYNNNCSTVTFDFSGILSVAASIMEDPNVVAGEEDSELKNHKPRNNEKEQ